MPVTTFNHKVKKSSNHRSSPSPSKFSLQRRSSSPAPLATPRPHFNFEPPQQPTRPHFHQDDIDNDPFVRELLRKQRKEWVGAVKIPISVRSAAPISTAVPLRVVIKTSNAGTTCGKVRIISSPKETISGPRVFELQADDVDRPAEQQKAVELEPLSRSRFFNDLNCTADDIDRVMLNDFLINIPAGHFSFPFSATISATISPLALPPTLLGPSDLLSNISVDGDDRHSHPTSSAPLVDVPFTDSDSDDGSTVVSPAISARLAVDQRHAKEMEELRALAEEHDMVVVVGGGADVVQVLADEKHVDVIADEGEYGSAEAGDAEWEML